MYNTKPSYAKKKINFKFLNVTQDILKGLKINTICYQARCPNISECFSKKVATFLILGDICTRACSFCNVKKGTPILKDFNQEIQDVILAIKRLQLKFVVITSVTRDDLEDGGASIFYILIKKIKEIDNNIKIEVLVPDFKGNIKALENIFKAKPDIFSHNLETVPSLYYLRKGASFDLSFNILRLAKENGLKTKTGIMLGLGEKLEEVKDLLQNLRRINCDFVSIGQYLQPSKNNCVVKEYVDPEIFNYLKSYALSIGFNHVESGPFVRSSYLAENYING